MNTMRLDPVEPGSRPELAELERRILQARGWEALFTAIRNRASLPARLRELAILRIAGLNRARYEFDAHVPYARKAGVSDEAIAALGNGIVSGALAPLDRLVLELTDAMTRDIEVPDALFERVREHFDAEKLVELVATIAAYNMVSRFLVALRIE